MSNTSVTRDLAVGPHRTQCNSYSAHDSAAFGPSEARGRIILIASMIVLGAVSWVWAAGVGRNWPVSECQLSPSPVLFATDTELTLIARRGASCPIFVRHTVASINQLQVTVVPQNGTISARAGTGVIYRPSRHYKGEDFFAFSMRVQLSNYVGTSLVRVRVTII